MFCIDIIFLYIHIGDDFKPAYQIKKSKKILASHRLPVSWPWFWSWMRHFWWPVSLHFVTPNIRDGRKKYHLTEMGIAIPARGDKTECKLCDIPEFGPWCSCCWEVLEEARYNRSAASASGQSHPLDIVSSCWFIVWMLQKPGAWSLSKSAVE